MMGNRLRLKIGLLIAILTSVTAAFQACTPMRFTSDSTLLGASKLSGGTGVDGKVFVSYGSCSQDQTASELIFAKDGSHASMVRENCADLTPGKRIEISELQFAGANSEVLQLNGRVFDLRNESGIQSVTVEFCQAAPAEVLVWQDVGNRSRYFGSVSDNAGHASGILNVQRNPAGLRSYRTQSGQSSQFDLDGSVRSLTYSINGGASGNLLNMNCATQSAPNINDGSVSAPTGSPQFPDLLRGYAVRAPWRVAGVDYSVGYAFGTVLKDPLTDPALAANPRVQVDTIRKMVVIDGDNVTLDGYDFSLHGGYDVVFSRGNNAVVSNSVLNLIQSRAASSNLTVRNCILDGLSTMATGWALISHQGAGTLTAEYNWLRNFPQDAVKAIGTGRVVYRYNLLQSGGLRAGGPSTFLYIGSETTTEVIVQHNTTYQREEVSPNNGFLFYQDAPGGSLSGELSFNTMIALSTSGRPSMGQLLQVGNRTSPVTASVHHNYADASGAARPFATGYNNDGVTNAAYFDNVNMRSGASLPTNP